MSNIIKLANGARLFVAPQKGTAAASIFVLFKVGSRNEDLSVWGASHFIEHLMFKGTTRRKTTLDISRELDRYGAEYNAYTGKDITGYWVKLAGDKLSVAIDLLEDMLFHSKFDAKEMQREKKVIVEEIKMYEENQIMHIEDLLEDEAFAGHALGRNIAGTKRSVLNMKREDVIKYHKAYYVPENMTVVLAGKVSASDIALVKKKFGSLPKRKFTPHDTVYTATKKTGLRITRQEKQVEQIQIAMGFPTSGRHHDDSDALYLLSSILGGTMSSRLFVEVREKRGLCYSVHTGNAQLDDAGVFTVRSGLDAARLPLALKTIANEIKRVVSKGVTAEELQMAKDHMEGVAVLRLEDAANQAEIAGRQIVFDGEVKTLEARLAKLRRVSLEDISRVAKTYLKFDNFIFAVIGPYKSDEEVRKIVTAAVGKKV